jgi:hypothetical protein
MTEPDWKSIYRRDAELLGKIGATLAQTALPKIQVRLPKALARAAVEAWERDGNEAGPGEETMYERVHRHRAGTLGLIGLAVQRDGRDWGEETVVKLAPELVGLAIEAADDL